MARARVGGDQHEAAPLALLFGEIREHWEDAALGGIEGAVDVGEVLDPADGAVGVVPGEEVVHVAGGEGLQRPVEPAGVVGVVEVLHHDLPVPRQVGNRLALQCCGRLQAVVGEHGVDLGHGRTEGPGVAVEVGHDEPLPDLHLELRERMIGPVEAGGPVHGRRAQQSAVQSVGPVVVGAGEAAAVAGPLRDHHSPVAAHGRHHPQLAVGVPGGYQRFARDGDAAEVPRLGQLVDPAHAQPLPLEDGPPLELVELRRRVQDGRQQPGLVHRPHGGAEAVQKVAGQHCHGSFLFTSGALVAAFDAVPNLAFGLRRSRIGWSRIRGLQGGADLQAQGVSVGRGDYLDGRGAAPRRVRPAQPARGCR